ncbi:MAG: hypothetical protein IPI54_10605 [Chitinophagaceae bacterium]|nr:hypothetical protein [Chitinophagaceae bacterium]
MYPLTDQQQLFKARNTVTFTGWYHIHLIIPCRLAHSLVDLPDRNLNAFANVNITYAVGGSVTGGSVNLFTSGLTVLV